jgi:2-polyprenyl-3-methyl-5-hydroxy-6-metoxy-1,4-benzoquinol methylase
VPESASFDADAFTEYERALRSHLTTYYGSTLGHPPEVVGDFIERRLSRERGKALASLLNRLVPVDGLKVLDVGSGWGELLLELVRLGADGHGIEPDQEEVAIAGLLLKSHRQEAQVVQGTGESLPWSDQTFDLVTCQQVLEHVRDVDVTVSELVRVTKVGGHLFVSVPNYLFPFEGHYGIKWVPLIPKSIGAVFLRRQGRDPAFLLHNVNYITYPKMMRLWKHHELEVRNITEELVLRRDHPNRIYDRRLVRVLATRFKLYPNVSWLLRRVM